MAKWMRFPAVLFVLAIGITLIGPERLIGITHWQWNQRIALEVETPSGVVSGSSMMTVRMTR